MSNPDYQYQYRSPFNFLEPYTKEHAEIFFGRDDEIDDVYLLFEKTNLVVIYGPSGSGKSSVAQCGLVNRFFDWQPIVIRRNQNIIDSFFDAIEIDTNADNEQSKGIFPKEECQKLRRIFDKLVAGAIGDDTHNFAEEDLAELREIVEELYLNLSIIPFYIFDQFEELFIENEDTSEIEQFSLLLSLITKRVTYSNVVICIQTEFFSHLVKLEGYNPKILNYKCEINDPDEDNIRKIIRGTFEKFNINQTVDGSNEAIPEEEQEARIDEIILRLRKVGSHLPFVQIYLDKLYVLDFEDTYEEHKDLLKTPKNIDTADFPLEFRKEEIEEYGQIDEILENYIDKVNTAVIAANNKIEHKGYEHTVVKFLKYFITENNTRRGIKAELRPRKNASSQKYYEILGEVKNEIVRSIWGRDRDDVDESIGDIIEELIEARILKYRNELLEFSHNFLVNVVKRISVDEDILEYYKRQFNSAFDTYMISDQSQRELLSPGQVRNLRPRIAEVLGKPIEKGEGAYQKKVLKEHYEERINKEEFWNRSRSKARWRKALIIGSYILMGATAIIYTTLRINGEINKEIIKDIREAKIKREVDSIRLLLNNKVSSAAEWAANDITQSFKSLDSFPSKINMHDSINPKEFALGLKMYHELLQNLVEEPFYKKKIRLFTDGKREQILSTKSRKLNDSQYVLFALTPAKLYSTKVVLNNNVHNTSWNEIAEANGKITAFEPYNRNDGEVRVLYSNSSGLYDSDWQLRPDDRRLIKSRDYAKNLKDIDHLGGQFFVALDEDADIIWYLGSSGPDQEYWFGPFKVPENNNQENEIIALKAFSDDPRTISYLMAREDYIVIYQHLGTEYKETPKDSFFFKKDPQLDYDVLRSFKLDTIEKLVLFEDDRKVYSISFEQFLDSLGTEPQVTDKIVSHHQAKINSIDNSGKFTLIGSNDKTATLYHDPNLSTEGEEVLAKTLKGHTDAIHNVSFLGSDHILTSSEDGTIALWDISDPASARTSRYEARRFIRIKHNPNNNRFYFAGFNRSNAPRQAYLFELTESTNTSKRLISNNYVRPGANRFNSNSFDFYDDLMYVGDRTRNSISVYQNGTKLPDKGFVLPESSSNPVIFDLTIEGERMAIAAHERIYYWPDLNEPNKVNIKKLPGTIFNSVDIHPSEDEGLLVISSEDKNLYTWNIGTNQLKPLNDAHIDRVRDARFSEDGNYMVSVSWDNIAILWKINAGDSIEKFREIKTHNSDVVTVATKINEENQLVIATGSSDNTVHLHGLDLNDEDAKLYRIPSIIRHDYAIRSVAFGEDVNTLYSADSRGNIKKWVISEFLQTIRDRTARSVAVQN